MKTMKKIAALLLALVMTVSFAACGGGSTKAMTMGTGGSGGTYYAYGGVLGSHLKAKTGITIDKRKIVISDPIKSVGTYTVTCKLGYEITAPLTVKIEEA